MPALSHRVSRLAALLLLICIATTLLFFSTSQYSFRAALIAQSPFSAEQSANNTQGRILITGGGGNIGKHLIRTLLARSTPVTVIDLVFHPDEYPDSPLLHVIIGDIRDPQALDRALTTDITGIIHLAAVSRSEWCMQNEPDCVDVNVRGTELVLDALSALNRGDSGHRWLVFASVYGNGVPWTSYVESKFEAERVIERRLESSGAGRTRAVSLRLSNVYGGAYDHHERLVSSLVTQALSHQLIQIVGGQRQVDLLHIYDCVDAFMLAISTLDTSHTWSLFSPKPLEVYDVASGSLARPRDLAETVISLTRSKSPIQDLPAEKYPLANYQSGDAYAKFGFKANMEVDEGIRSTVREYLLLTERFLAKEIVPRCTFHQEHVDLQRLDNCNITLMANGDGHLNAVSPDQGTWFSTPHFPPPTLRINVRTTESGVVKAVFTSEERGFRKLILPAEFRSVGTIRLSSENQSLVEEGAIDEWDLELHADSGTVRLVVPGSNLQLAPPSTAEGTLNFALVERNHLPGLFRITPICCPTPPPWPFLRDDPLVFMIDYQYTDTARPFNTSSVKEPCNRLQKAQIEVRNRLENVDRVRNADVHLANYSSKAFEWSQADLPPCSNLCEHPTICVDTGDCRCVLSACVPRSRFPFSSQLYTSNLSYPPKLITDLATRISRMSWMTVLRPQAARYINANATKFPNVYVSPLDPGSAHWRQYEWGTAVDKLQAYTCISEDTMFQRVLALMGASPKTADMVFVPHFQWRGMIGDSMNGRIMVQYDWSRKNVPLFDEAKVIIPYTHDWGICLYEEEFIWYVWEIREKKLPPGPSKATTAWAGMGDINSPCYRPQQDVVIPGRSCRTPDLYSAFSDKKNVRKPKDRRVLVTFSGSTWGAWKTVREQIMCPRTEWNQSANNLKTIHSLSTIWGSLGRYPSYVSLLNETLFCPSPGGTTGWSTRPLDALFAGCIPVFFGNNAEQPFFDILDWSKISVRVELTDVDRLEEVLLTRYTMDDIERLQANMMLVRNALFYPLDGESDEDVLRMMLHDRGPLFFALHSTGMRLATRWPTT